MRPLWSLVAAALLVTTVLASAAGAESPFILQAAHVAGTDAIGLANQGYSVAISADGNTAIMGGVGDNSSMGAAWVFVRNSGGIWSQQGPKLLGTGATGIANQGISVAISADGNTALVGGSFDNSGIGAAWVFVRSGGVWSPQGTKLVGTGRVGNSNQGIAVALSADGNTALVGGHSDNSGQGATWVFVRSGGVWAQQGSKLVGTGAVGNAALGWSVALSADGNTALMGGHGDNLSVGATWVFVRSGSVWSQMGGKLIGSGATGNAAQGYSVALSADGSTAVVGGVGDDGSRGATWIFARSGGVWTQQGAKRIGTGAVGNSNQGKSVSVSASGNKVLVGGSYDDTGHGAAWVFVRSGGSWSQQGNKLAGTGAANPAYVGWAVALSADGSTAFLGGYQANDGWGAAWVYAVPSPRIVDILDVPLDQGGKVHVLWSRSVFDVAGDQLIARYSLWRRITTAAASQALGGGGLLLGPGDRMSALKTTGRRVIRSLGVQSEFWEFVVTVPARGATGYGYMTPTTSDSLPGSIPWNVFFVDAEPVGGFDVYYLSDPDSGYSVDNLPPGPPAPVAAAYAGGATHVHWGASLETDFGYFRLYRGGSAEFIPSPANLVTAQSDTGYADAGPSGSYYKLSAVDVHGNESAFALITPQSTLDAPVAGLFPHPSLAPVVPNPLRGGGGFQFALPRDATVSLGIYDASGRLVRTLASGTRPAGQHHESWDGHDQQGRAPASGVYFVRLQTMGRSLSARFVWMR